MGPRSREVTPSISSRMISDSARARQSVVTGREPSAIAQGDRRGDRNTRHLNMQAHQSRGRIRSGPEPIGAFGRFRQEIESFETDLTNLV